MKSAEPRQLTFVFADSPQGDKARGPQDESSGKRLLVHTAKGNGWMEPATCTAAERRLMESVASASNLAQALLNVLRNKAAPGADGRSVEKVVDEARLCCLSCRSLFSTERINRAIFGGYGFQGREAASVG